MLEEIKYKMATSMIRLSNFSTILDLTPAEAISIVKMDKWIPSNPTAIRFVKYESTEPTKINSVIVKKELTAGDIGFTKIDTNIDIVALTPETELTNEQFATILFSVNGNNGPFKIIKKFITSGGNPDTDDKKKFLAHLAWISSNGGIDDAYVNTDPLVQLEKMLDGTLEMPNMDMGNEIFASPMFTTYMKALAIVDMISKNGPTIMSGIRMDLDRTNSYIMNIKPSQSGGKQKKKKSTRKAKNSF